MNLKELKEIIDIVTSNESIEELEIEKSGVRLRIRRSSNHVGSVSTASVASIAASSTITSAPAPSKVLAEIEELVYIKSPIVGTFLYRAQSRLGTICFCWRYGRKGQRPLHHRSNETHE